MALGREEVVSLRGAGEIAIVILPEAVPPEVSVAVAVKVNVAALNGIPEIVPEGVSESPSGSPPPGTIHVYGGAPPLALRVAEYGTPTVPFGSAPADTLSAEGVATTSVNADDAGNLVASV